jgi:hypothetical protein
MPARLAADIGSITLLQTADADVHEPMLRENSWVNRLYCVRCNHLNSDVG